MDYSAIATEIKGLGSAVTERLDALDSQIAEVKNAYSVSAVPSGMTDVEYKAFADYLRSGRKDATPSLTTTPTNAGDVALTHYEGQTILDVIKDRSAILPFMRHVDVAGNASLSVPVFTTDLEPSIVGENAVRPLTNATVKMKSINLSKVSAKCAFSLEMLNCYKPYSVYNEIVGQAVREISDKMGKQATSNILADTDVPSVTSANATKIVYDDLIDLMASVPSAVEDGNEAFFMNKATFANIVKNFGKDSVYALMPYNAENKPVLCGKPVVFLPEMDTVAATKKTVLYGNLDMGTRYVTAGGINSIRDDYTGAPNGLIYLWNHALFGAGVVQPNAMAVLKQKSS